VFLLHLLKQGLELNKKIYLHIGLEKTGTTAIQHALKANKKLLLSKYKLYCPELIGFNSIQTHHKFAKFFIKKNIAKHHIKLIDSEVKQILDNFQNHKIADSLIISSELFSYLQKDEIRFLYNYLKGNKFEVKIILFLRRQDDYLEAQYGQHLKNVWAMGRSAKSKAKFTTQNLNFYEFILKWQTSGFNDIKLKLYDKTNTYNIYKEFFNIFNYDIFFNEEIHIPKKIINPSLTPLHMELMINYVGKIKDLEIRAKVSKVIFHHNNSYSALHVQNFIKKNLYTEKEKGLILSKYKESNQKILAQFFSNSSKSKLFNVKESAHENNIGGIEALSKQQIISLFFNLLIYLVKNANSFLNIKSDLK